ncbi:glycosyltransferase [Coraliomargarita algicola]|uniref:Glycosyltransferase n=1 Tax=Coraliomargarita algicola TaxID=3092156 RepID=A0ABZ0RPC2_9BACT|nr:glycosyltransferase [Coraliomargarita sp. J2-16]WPJ97377.1 glycosyltransferase [Coraliomargarita sp. J2-16]
MSLLIITPTLNRSKFLDETIRSVKACAPGAEHILSAPAAEVASLQQQYPSIKVVADRGRAGGMYGAINAGITAAESEWEWFTYINDDDLLYPGFSKMVKVHTTKHAAADFAHGVANHIDETGKLLYPIPSCPRTSLLPYLIAAGVSPISQQGMLIKRAVFERIGTYDQSFKYAADMEFYCRLYAKGGTFSFYPIEVAGFRICNEQLSQDIAPFEKEKVTIRTKYFSQPSFINRAMAKLTFRIYNLPKYLIRLSRIGFKTSKSAFSS